MSKIKGQIALIFDDLTQSWVIRPLDVPNLLNGLKTKFLKNRPAVKQVILTMEIGWPHVEKTVSQLGYLHAAVWPVFYQYYRDQGLPVETEEHKEKVRDDVKWAIGFAETTMNVFYGPNTSRVRSFASASKEETSEAIDAIIRLAADYGMIVPEPGEYLQKIGREKFDS